MRSALATSVSRPEPSAPAQPEPGARLALELHRGLDVRGDDAAAWERLVEHRPDAGIFASREWLAGYFSEPPAGAEPVLGLLREGTRLRGIVPLAVRPTRTHVQIALLGGGMGSDRIDLLAARGFEAACADVFLASLGERFGSRGFLLELRDVPATSALWGAIHRAGLERTLRFALQPRDVHTLPFLDLTQPPGDRLADAPSARTLRSIEKHRRLLERRCRLRIDLLDDEAEVMDAFASLAAFLHVRWRGGQQGSVLDDPRACRFHHRVLPLLLRAGRLRMIRLRADDRTIAVFYGMAAGSWWGYYLAGYDREWAGRIHLGHVTLAVAIEQAARERAAEFDFLKGAERTKYLWPVLDRAALDADLFSDRSGAQFARATRATRDAAAALTKSARHLFLA